jgi:RNA polymerase sigma factor (sigma-70 family)
MNPASSPHTVCVSSYLFNSKQKPPTGTECTPDNAAMPVDNGGMSIENHDALLIVLIDRIARQDDAAFKALYDQCATKLYGLALRVVTHRELAEDVLQEAFMTIWRNAADYRASLSPPMAWLGLIVRSRGLDLLRRRAAERTHLTDELDDTLADTLDANSPTPLDTAQASEQAWALHQCLGQLENKQREVVSLAYVRDLSHSELAQQLRLPLGTVKTWIRRGLDQLRMCMARFA